MTGTHNLALVLLSVMIAVASSYTALDLAGRVRAAGSRAASWAWLSTAAVAMGGGIWSMHFVAMLAYKMHGMVAYYDLPLTAFSLVLAVVVTGFGFAAAGRPASGFRTIVVAGLFMGLGIVGMHYTGMAAMRMPVSITYDPGWVAVSAIVAVGAAIAALWLAFKTTGIVEKTVAAIAMGLAISGMHYAGMLAATYVHHHQAEDIALTSTTFDQSKLAVAVAATTFVILFLALVAAMFDRRFALMAESEAGELRRSEELFRSLYRKTPLPLHSLNEFGRIEEVSEAWLNLLGHSRGDVIGKPLVDFMTEKSARQRLEKDWPQLLAAGELLEVEYRFLAKNGNVLDVLSSSQVERDAGGGFVAAIGGLVDITARKRAEAALRQSQKMEAVGQLTGGVAHDFNNLLAVVLGNLEMAQKRLPADEKLMRYTENAIAGAKRGAILTQRMLAFARQQSLNPETVDVVKLVGGMEDLLQRSIGPQIKFETQFSAENMSVTADAHQLELVLLNLAVNARDAMPRGGIIRIAAHQRRVLPADVTGLNEGLYLCLSVVDEGDGMDEATLARAREPFFTTKGVSKGTGLGLSMVHGFAEQSGGTLLLRSRPGEGTTAEIWLPAAAGGKGAAQSQHVVAEPARPAPRRLVVLAVDDDVLVLLNTVAMLEDLGHKVLSAGSGQEAIGVIESDPSIDIVITDYAMPGMTGLQLAQAIRLQRWNKPILLATGYADIPGEAELKLPRLGKPFMQEQLEQAIADSIYEKSMDWGRQRQA